MDFSGAAAHSILAHISGELAGTAPHVQSILTTLTRSLSRIRSGTWFAVLLDLDPSTSHVVVAGDSDGSMSAYVDGFVKTLAGPTGTPTLTLSQQVVETSDPVLIPSVPFTDFISLLSPAGQSYFSSHPPPHALDAVGVLEARSSARWESSTGSSNQRCPRTTSCVCSWWPIMWRWRWRTRDFRRRC